MVIASEKLQKYFESIETETLKALKIATAARQMGFDPEKKVDIPIAKNMAERVLGLISAVAPQLSNSNIVQRIVELEKEYSPLDWRVGFKIAEEVAKEKFCKFNSKKEALEVGIRTGFTYLTGGIVSAPLEGFVEAKIKKRQDGKEYVASLYAGPIRGAGGTAAATSVVLTDYVATKLGYEKYDPTDAEVNRIVTELYDYNDRVSNLQYLPSEEEIKFMFKHLPVEVDGDPSERIEVSNYKDLPRIETNFIRGGVCLVIGEGLCQKSPKIWKRLSKWGKEFGIDWSFLEQFLALQKEIKSKTKKKETTKGVSPNFTFINDLVAGRPVLTYPMAYGGFRLRYGRTRLSGFSAIVLSPLTMNVLDNFIVYGTQMKVERPGKAGTVTICEAIDGPTVLLNTGEVTRLTNENKHIMKNIEKILFLGDIMINYGDFSENGHMLIPSGYCEEWWSQELKLKIKEVYASTDTSDDLSEALKKLSQALSSQALNIAPDRLNLFINDYFMTKPSFIEAYLLSKTLKIPLHPNYIYYYTAMSNDDFSKIIEKMHNAKITLNEQSSEKCSSQELKPIKSIVINYDEQTKKIFENIGLPHQLASKEFIVIQNDEALSFAAAFGLFKHSPEDLQKLYAAVVSNDVSNNNSQQQQKPLELLNQISEVEIRDKAGTFIGARMGRPEKAKMRKLQGSPQVLFPVGEQGGRLRSFQSSMEQGEITSDFPIYYCEKCKKKTVFGVCHICSEKTKKMYFCPTLNKEVMSDEPPISLDPLAKSFKKSTINIQEYVESCLRMMKTKVYPDLIKGVKGTSNKDHIPEHLIKGLLRAKYDIYVNKDGTTRYDMSEAPITAFKPKEVGVTIDKLRDLGYTEDIYGNKLENVDQVVEIFPQDVILPAKQDALEEQADDVMLRIANFVDELMSRLYGLKKYYNYKSKEELIGSLIVCLAPHISCGTVGRVIGFSLNQVMIAHPMMHAAMRRDCDGDEACFIMLMDAFLNFSRQYLPDKRGTRTMDAPLVLSIIIQPSEVDDQVHGVDVVQQYPLELYKAAQEFKYPWDVKVEQLKDRINTPLQYERFFSTHPVEDMNFGPKVSAYKILPSMQEKLDGQMSLARKIRAVDDLQVASMVIQKHFLKDIKGNLRKFSTQEFRCVQCNSKFRRPPLIGKCSDCGGKLVFTISEGSITKYLGASIELANKYNVPKYLKQTLELTKERVDSVFGKEKDFQEGLARFF